MNQSKKILAALVAVPASVVVADGVLAAETTATQTFEIKNEFIGTTNYSTVAPSQVVTIDTKDALNDKILLEMSKYNKSFSINYTGNDDVKAYKIAIEDVMKALKNDLNTTKTVTSSGDSVLFDTTELYGVFNNMRVKATETKTNDNVTSVKLEFAVNYFGDAAELKAAKDKFTAINVNSTSSDVANIKAVHDYIILNAYHSSSNHRLNLFMNGGTSHAYALWGYILLKRAIGESNVRYVYGSVNGEKRSWNIVKIDGEWYHLDLFGNDSNETKSGSKEIKYHNFLTYTANNRGIYSGASDITISNDKYNYFKTIDNLAQSAKHIYYAAAESNGEIKQLDLANLESSSLNINIAEATTGIGRMVYYQQTSSDSATVDNYLYFINDSRGKYLYRYDLDDKKLELLLKEQLQSIKLTAPTLTFVTLTGEKGFIPLDNIVDLDKELAQKVIDEINRLKLITIITQTFKNDVMKVRQMYMALTASQKEFVIAENYADLLELEKKLSAGANVNHIVNLINALDEMDKDYVKNVKAAQEAYESFNNQSAVYNYSILETANKRINEARTLKSDLDDRRSKVPENSDLFDVDADAIVFIEGLLKKYDSYLPSIREGIGFSITDIEELRTDAATLRAQAQNFINEVKLTDENMESFLTDMEALAVRQSTLSISQQHLIRTDDAVVTNKLALATTMKQQVETFKNYMSTISSGDVATIKLTEKLAADIKAAQALYDKMKPAQLALISAPEKSNLKTIIERINKATTAPELNDLEKQILALNISQMTSLEDIQSQVSTVDSAIITVKDSLGFNSNEDVIALLSAAAKNHLEVYRNLANNVEAARTLKTAMESLNNESTEVIIKELRNKYEALNAQLKKFFTEELKKLQEQEARLTKGANQFAADKITEKINALTDESSYVDILAVNTEYSALSADVKALIPETAKKKLEELLKKAQSSQAAVEEVNKLIKALSEKSTKEEIQKVEEAYKALSPEQQVQVVGYDKIATLLAALEAKEGAELDQLAAQKVIEMIATLTDESSKKEIEAVRAAYGALSDVAKALIPNSTLEILAYYESRLAELSETAQKEAAVVQDRINRITSSYTEAQIKNIRIAYNALSAMAKTYVTNLQKLIDAENNVIYQNTIVKQAKLDANAFDVYMNDINRNSTTAEIAQARANYNRLSAEAKKHVTTYEKLVRLETMWKDPEYLNLVFTYYPEYVHEVKPGAIVVPKPTYDPLYIPDDSSVAPTPSAPSVATNPVASWSAYETMRYQNGRYTTTITSTQVKNSTDRNMRLKADNIEIVIPTADLKAQTATVGVSVNVENNQLNIQFTEGNNVKTFSEYVEIHVPFSVLKGNAAQLIERVSTLGSTATSFKVDGSTFIIRTKSSGTFKATTATTYTDIPSGAQGDAIRELAKRGIQFNTTSRLVQSYKQVTKMDVALMIATALDLSSNTKSKYQDLESDVHVKRAQGLLEAGIMSGSTSSRFNPTGTVTKQEAAIIIANMYRYLNQDLAKAYNNLNSSYGDVVGLTLEARQSIAILELFGVVSGTGSFEPTKQLSRAEFAEFIYKALTAIDYL